MSYAPGTVAWHVTPTRACVAGTRFTVRRPALKRARRAARPPRRPLVQAEKQWRLSRSPRDRGWTPSQRDSRPQRMGSSTVLVPSTCDARDCSTPGEPITAILALPCSTRSRQRGHRSKSGRLSTVHQRMKRDAPGNLTRTSSQERDREKPQTSNAARAAGKLRKVRLIHFMRSAVGQGRTIKVFLYQPLGAEPRRIPLSLCDTIVFLNNEPDAEPDPYYGRPSVRGRLPRTWTGSTYHDWG